MSKPLVDVIMEVLDELGATVVFKEGLMKVRRFLDSIGLPHQPDVETQLFKRLKAATRPMDAQTAYKILADDFNLSLLQRNAGRQDDPSWHWLVRQAKRRLKDAGILDTSQPRDHWLLNAAGRRLEAWPPKPTLEDLA